MEPLFDLDARLQMLQEDMVVLRRKQDEDRAMIKRLLEKTRNTLSKFQYQLSELGECIALNRMLRCYTIDRYKRDILGKYAHDDALEILSVIASHDGDALADCLLYEYKHRDDPDVYELIYGFNFAEVRCLGQCAPLINAISLRGTITMDGSLTKDDRQHFAGMVQSLLTRYWLLEEGEKENAFDHWVPGLSERLISDMDKIVAQFERLRAKSLKTYKRGSGLYDWGHEDGRMTPTGKLNLLAGLLKPDYWPDAGSGALIV